MQIFLANNGGDKAAEAVEATFDLLQFVAGLAIGAVCGFLIAFLLLAVLRIIPARNPALRPLFSATSKKIVVLLFLIGAWMGADYSLNHIASAEAPKWLGRIDHIFLILVILSGTWLIVGVINGVVAIIHATIRQSSARRAKRVQTQTQILQRVIVVAIWVMGIAGVLLTFPGARAAGASVLASAGVVSVLVGLAAQTTLSNVFAGLQLAFSDSIRVGDIVFYQGSYTSVEEITLTYVVLEIWDGRRIIVPSTKMVTEPFENWTRRAPEMTGEVIWEVDWDLPISAARRQLEYVLSQTDLWDGKTGILQIKAAEDYRLKMRAVVSAKDSATLADLQHYVREKMVVWIQEEAPQAVPHLRKSSNKAKDFQAAQAATWEKMNARLEKEKPVLYLPKQVAWEDESFLDDDERTLTLSLSDMEDLFVGEEENDATKTATDTQLSLEKTQIMPRIALDEVTDTAQREKISTAVRAGHEASLFTGSIAAEERRKNFTGEREEDNDDAAADNEIAASVEDNTVDDEVEESELTAAADTKAGSAAEAEPAAKREN